jgi:hypothetical protein
MDRINTGRVMVGGLLAGLVMNVFEYVLNGMILLDEWEAAAASLGLAPTSGSAVAMFIVLYFLLGIIAVWLYAAMRPRFGPGPRTAVIAGLLVWLLIYVFPTMYNGLWPIFPNSLMMTATVVGVFEVPIGTMAGAWLYREGEKTEPDAV